LIGGDTVADIARMVLNGAPDRFAMAGVGLGGIVAMEVIRRAPDRVARLALLDTNSLAETPQTAAAREPQIARVRAGRLADVIRDEMNATCQTPGQDQDEIMDLMLTMARWLGPDTFIAQSRAMQRRPDQQRTLRQITVPTLVMCGEHDTLCPVRRHEFMADLIPNARLLVVPEAGHLPMLEQPGITTRVMGEWLAGW
jgi:pimeloyl-ACP methyl ester carboxylesterase